MSSNKTNNNYFYLSFQDVAVVLANTAVKLRMIWSMILINGNHVKKI